MIKGFLGWTLSVLTILALTACGGGSSGSGGGSSNIRSGYITLTGPKVGGPVSKYATRDKWVMPGGNAEVPDSVDCSNGDVFTSVPPEYRITVVNKSNGYKIEGFAGVICQFGIARISWTTIYPVPLEIGKNQLIARVSYPPEKVSGKTTQIINRRVTDGPIIEHIYPEEYGLGGGIPFVSLDTEVRATFDSEIDPASTDADTFIVRDQNSVPVTGQVEVKNVEISYLVSGSPVPHPDWTYSRVIFTPDFPLPPSAEIAVTISGKIKDTDGREMGDDYNWSFRTW